MTIQVISNGDPVAAQAAEKVAEETKSAPVAEKAAEQTEGTESEAVDTEAKEETAEDEESEETSESTEATDKPKKKSGSQRRKERAERAEAEVARLHGLLEQMALKGAGDSKTEKADTPKTDNRPKPEAFETHAEYVEALTDWKTEEKFKERETKEQQTKLKSEQEKLFTSHSERVRAFAEKVEDFEDVVAEADDVRVSAAVEEIIVSSENGPALMYELAKNKAEFRRICALSPLAAAREIGKLEAKVSSKPPEEKKPENKTTKAPKPLTPVDKGTAKVHRSLEDIAANGTQAEYEAFRREQEKRRNAS